MKKFLIILCFLINYTQIWCIEVFAINEDIVLPEDNEVYIADVGIVMPLGKILLVRKNSDYCAIKFTKFWLENTSEVGSFFVASGSDEYAMYEAYYQGDKTGNFSKNNVQFKKEKLSAPKPRGIGRLAFSFGDREIKCGTMKLEWFGKGGVHFYGESQKKGNYGIELAPTKWNDISEVNVFDSRLKWYSYDEKRERVNISLDQLWEEKKNEADMKCPVRLSASPRLPQNLLFF